MPGFGAELKRLRESRDLSLDALAEATSIGRAYLEALEREDFNELPGRAIGKLYIREYAERIGFDAQPLIDDYAAELARREREGEVRPRRWLPPPPEEAPPAPADPWWRKPFLLPAAVALLAVAAVLLTRTAPEEPEAVPAAEPAPPPAPVAVAPAPSPPAALPEPEPAPPEPASPASGLAVDDSGLGREVVERRIGRPTDRFEEGETAWFLTRVTGGRAGQRIRHVWIRDGKTVQAIALRVGGSPWRTYSAKTLWGVGAWAVEARDEDGRVLARAAFTCEPKT